MKIVTGDLLQLAREGAVDVIVHGANCQCTMGAGIAKVIRETFPEAYEADRATPKGDPSKLGDISVARVTRGKVNFAIVNAYTQLHYRGPGVRVDYEAVRNAMLEVRDQFTGLRIGYPRIGAGLGGGDWNRIAGIIEYVFKNEDHTLVELPSAPRPNRELRRLWLQALIRSSFISASRAVHPIILSGLMCACGSRTHDGVCAPGEGTALVYAPTRGSAQDAEPRRGQIESIDRVQLVIGRDEVVVFIAAREVERSEAAKKKVLAETDALGLDFRVEDFASIDAHCTVRLEHQDRLIERAAPAP